MRWKVIGALMLLAISASTALMQDTADIPASALTEPAPEVVVYEPATGALYSVTAEGLQPLADLSEIVDPSARDYKLAPDRAHLVFFKTDAVDGVLSGSYYVADVLMGTCCIKLDPQDKTLDDVFRAIFSPDGSQLAVAHYNSVIPMEMIPGQIVVYDLATGAVVARLDSTRIERLTYMMEAPAPGIWIHHWTEAGLLVNPTCTGCEPSLEGIARLWNPVDDSLSEPVIPFTLGTKPLGTGETIAASFDATFPNNPDAVGMGPVPNVVTYTPASADPTTTESSRVIYFNPDNLYIHTASWVADGQAVLIQHNQQDSYFTISDEATLLLRDGTQIPLTIPTARPYVASTTDGWVMRDKITRHYVYYRLNGATVEEIELESHSSEPVAVETFLFGASLESEVAFPQVIAP